MRFEKRFQSCHYRTVPLMLMLCVMHFYNPLSQSHVYVYFPLFSLCFQFSSVLLEVYSAYVNNFTHAMETAKKAASQKPVFREFVEVIPEKVIQSSIVRTICPYS